VGYFYRVFSVPQRSIYNILKVKAVFKVNQAYRIEKSINNYNTESVFLVSLYNRNKEYIAYTGLNVFYMFKNLGKKV
jgi:hypothetical protein